MKNIESNIVLFKIKWIKETDVKSVHLNQT